MVYFIFAAALAIQQEAALVHEGKPISQWIAELDHKKYDVQQKAEKAIEALGPAAVPALIERLSDPKPQLRRASPLRSGSSTTPARCSR